MTLYPRSNGFSYTAMAVLCTVPLAVASWWAIEKHTLKLKTLGIRASAAGSPGAIDSSDSAGSRSTEVAGPRSDAG